MRISNCALSRLASAVALGLSLAAVVLLGFRMAKVESLAAAQLPAHQALSISSTGIITAVGRRAPDDGQRR